MKLSDNSPKNPKVIREKLPIEKLAIQKIEQYRKMSKFNDCEQK